MQIDFHRGYLKAYDKLPQKIQIQAERRIAQFIQNRKEAQLRDHALTGNLIGKRSFSVTGNYRIIYQEIEEEVVFLFIDIGTHAKVYK